MQKRKESQEMGFSLLRFSSYHQIVVSLLRLHRIILQGSSARDFVPVQSFKNGGILYVFPVFGTAEMAQKIR